VNLIRTLIWWMVAGGMVVVVGIPTALLSIPDPKRRPIGWGAYLWSWVLMKAAGCTMEVEGREKLKAHKHFVVVSNHQSYFDIFTLICILKTAPHFLAKKELFRIPVFGQLLSLAQVLKIDRQNPEAAVATINANLAKGMGRPIAIFPEGTRSPDGCFQPFRKKGLNILIETELPMFPIGIKGTRDAMSKGRYSVRPAKIQVKIGDPLFPKSGLSDEEKDSVREDLWKSIHTLLETL